MQIGGTHGADFQLVTAGSAGTSLVGGGGGSTPSLASTLPAMSVVGGVGGAVGGGAGGVGVGGSAIPTMIPFAQPAVAPVANTGAAGGQAAQARIQALVAGTAVPTAQEKPIVDAIRRAQQPAAAAAPAAAAPAAAGTETSAYEQRVLELVNIERAKEGLGPVRYRAELDQAATSHNAQQARMQTMAHEGIGDGTPGDRARAVGWNDSWGENVAVGQTSPEQVVAEWMASPGHRRNIMDPAYTQMGVSHTTDTAGRQYWAQTFGA